VPKDQPYCLFVWFHAPHEPVATPEEFTSLYPGYDDPTKPIYYGSVTMVDHEVGRVLQALDARGQRENTLVTFTSDNGPETLKRYKNASHSHGSPGPLRGMKLHVYEGGYRVPGILRWPARIRPGQVVDEPVCGVDFLPTFCELAGASLPTGVAFDGASFLPALEGKPVRRSTPLYWEYDRALGPNKLSLREGAWKVLSDLKIEQVELYNLKDDISETRNLTAGEPDRTRGLIEKLKQKYQDVNQSADDSE
jgi:arylsulfatase A